ncbi:hypothetical protein U5801_11775 [Lamprobacter modestohalophilus]|uniref:hypothetical protein n=1 Tax=Lamprobacter modestohalophilus TaxID=1064514 RepID=UPI002ADEBBA1|nr:hypothetical protein [Lamprobacter modestohalophilus]MEA1050483.1 hypothetical protein [Lamprobacter modestohalophilus]
MNNLAKGQTIYVRSMGKALQVTALFDNDDEANAWMGKPGNEDAVVACWGHLVVLANKYDRGIPLPANPV